MKPVRFVKARAPFNPGDVAAFDRITAAGLIDAGAAEATEGAPVSIGVDLARGHDLSVVRFIASSGPYNPGDVAGFAAISAAELVAGGAAVPLAEAALEVEPAEIEIEITPEDEPELVEEPIEDAPADLVEPEPVEVEGETAPEDEPELIEGQGEDAPADLPEAETAEAEGDGEFEEGAPPVQGV